jgi:hypothetical protein
MRSMQEKILEAVTAALEAPGLETVQAAKYANTGRLWVQSGFTTHAEVQYRFDSTSCTISMSGPAVDAAGLADQPPEYRVERFNTAGAVRVSWGALHYVDGQRISGLVDVAESVATHAYIAAAATQAGA